MTEYYGMLTLLRLAEIGAKQMHQWEPRRGPKGDHALMFEDCHNEDCRVVRDALAAAGLVPRHT